eukprot:SAG11_NODE_129_length_15500_cov_16.145250_20_plen_177_part_00
MAWAECDTGGALWHDRLALSIWFASANSELLCFPSRIPAHVHARARQDPHGVLANELPKLLPRVNRCDSPHFSPLSNVREQPSSDGLATDTKHRILPSPSPLCDETTESSRSRLLSKVLYRDEYARSFVDAFGESEAVRAALALDAMETSRAEALLSPDLALLLRTELPFKALKTA